MCGAIYHTLAGGYHEGAAYAFELQNLALDANMDAFVQGNTMTLTSCGGLQSALGLLAVVDVSGLPLFQRLDQGLFDLDGQRGLTATVPSGLAGLQVSFLALGYFQPGVLGLSNLKTVTFN